MSTEKNEPETQTKKPDANSQGEPNAGGADDQPHPQPEPSADAPQPPSDLADEMAADLQGGMEPRDRQGELEGELATTKDRMLRALAEAENVRRRAERDVANAHKYAISNFARDMLSVADNLSRAMAAIDAPARKENEALNNLAVGVEMTFKDLQTALDRSGVKPIDAEGKKFDHNLHEALFEIENPDVPSGTVLQVLETGYTLGDRLLRAAKVGVSKGGPKTAVKPEPTPEENPTDKTADAKAYEKKADQDKAQSGSTVDEQT